MKREIKFRLWNGVEWLNVDEITLYDLEHQTKGCVFQQYTGLKDKNGVEIYEGDIVKIFNHDLYEEVVYEPQGSGFGFFMHDDENRDNAAFEFLSDWTGSDGYEVIGNIFENPNY